MVEAERAFAKEDWKTASAKYQRVAQHIRHDSIQLIAWHHAGLCEFHQEAYSLAIRCFENQLLVSSTGVHARTAFLLKSLSKIELEEWEDAVSALNAAIELARKEKAHTFPPVVLLQAGQQFARKQREKTLFQRTEACECFERVLNDDHATSYQRFQSHEGLANWAQTAGEYRMVIQHLKEDIKLNPSLPQTEQRPVGVIDLYRFQIGQAHWEIHETEAAIAAYSLTAELGKTPRWVGQALYEKAILHQREGQREAMLDTYYELVTRLPQHRHAAEARRSLEDDLRHRFDLPR